VQRHRESHETTVTLYAETNEQIAGLEAKLVQENAKNSGHL
jgi:hypothetical protein